MLSLFTSPIFRKTITALICCGIGFYIGFSLRSNKIEQLKQDKYVTTGKFQVISSNYKQLQVTNDTLLSVIIELAKQERVKVDNHITDTKVKDGSQLNFIPKTRAKLTVTKTKTVDVTPVITKLEPITQQQQPNDPTEEKKRDSWLRRLFTRKKAL